MNSTKNSAPMPAYFDTKLDLVLERVVNVSPELIWKGWTQPEHLKKWFCPRPWQVTDCEIDLKPGGKFRTVMEGPEGQRHDETGCYLLVEPNRRLVWTDSLGPGFRPKIGGFMTGMLVLTPEGTGTRYTAFVLHKDADDREQHEKMGFATGWGTALEQLLEVAGSF